MTQTSSDYKGNENKCVRTTVTFEESYDSLAELRWGLMLTALGMHHARQGEQRNEIFWHPDFTLVVRPGSEMYVEVKSPADNNAWTNEMRKFEHKIGDKNLWRDVLMLGSDYKVSGTALQVGWLGHALEGGGVGNWEPMSYGLCETCEAVTFTTTDGVARPCGHKSVSSGICDPNELLALGREGKKTITKLTSSPNSNCSLSVTKLL